MHTTSAIVVYSKNLLILGVFMCQIDWVDVLSVVFLMNPNWIISQQNT